MGDRIVFKVVDYVEHDLKWEEEECNKLGVRFEAYQLKFAPPEEIIEKCRDGQCESPYKARYWIRQG